MTDKARELLERVLNLWDTDDFIRDDDIEEIRAYLASEKQERQEPKYKVFVNDEGLWFSVGSQSFTIAYESDNIKEMEWMKLQLEKALASIGAPIESNNIAKMIENSVPTRPLKGDIWKDTSVTPNEYYIWDDNRWLRQEKKQMTEEKKSFLDDPAWQEASKAFQEAIAEDEQRQEEYWQSLTPDQQLDAFCCVARRIHRGDVQERGSYRYVLYDVFGWGPESYVPAQCAGYLDIHNLIYSGIEHEDCHRQQEVDAEVAVLEELTKSENAEVKTMNERIIELALQAHLLNYVDNETPRRHFVCGHADVEEVQEFARLVIAEFCTPEKTLDK